MKQPIQRPRNTLNFFTFPVQIWPINHNYWQSKVTGSVNFTSRTASSRIFGYKQIYFIFLQKSDVTLFGKRPTRNNTFKIGQRNFKRRWVDKAQKVIMLRLSTKFGKMHAPKSKHDTTHGHFQQTDGGSNTIHFFPQVSFLCDPRRPTQSEQRDFQMRASINCITAHFNCKRMGSINDMRNGGSFKIFAKTLYSTEPAYPFRQRLRFDTFNAARIRQNSVYTYIADFFGEKSGLYRSGQYEKVNSHG